MNQVYDHAQRGLAALESEGAIPKGEWAPRDLIDDVLVSACEKFGERPRHTTLDVWLLELLNGRLEDLCQQPEALSLATSSAPVLEADSQDDSGSWDEIEHWMEHLMYPPESALPDVDELERASPSDPRW